MSLPRKKVEKEEDAVTVEETEEENDEETAEESEEAETDGDDEDDEHPTSTPPPYARPTRPSSMRSSALSSTRSSTRPPSKRGVKTCNSGRWTDARFRQFIISQLRAATRKWGPIVNCQKKAHVARGLYMCAGCRKAVPPTLPPQREGGRRVSNIAVDHIDPIVDPSTGFTSWDDYIERLFCEESGLQLLCRTCHMQKTAEELSTRVSSRRSAALSAPIPPRAGSSSREKRSKG